MTSSTARSTDIATSAERQHVTLSNGEADFRAPRRRGKRPERRPAPQARHGAARHQQDPLDHARLRPRAGGRSFPFPALTYYGEQPSRPHCLHHAVSDRRDDAREPLRLSRHGRSVAEASSATRRAKRLKALMPGLRRDHRRLRDAGAGEDPPGRSLCHHGRREAGVVLVGDAFATSCPAAGTGTGKVFTDVERLCNVHIPRWLATPRHGRGQDRGVLRRPGEARLRRAFGGEGILICARSPSIRGSPGRAALGALPEARRDRDAARTGRRVKRSEPTFGAGTTSRALPARRRDAERNEDSALTAVAARMQAQARIDHLRRRAGLRHEGAGRNVA